MARNKGLPLAPGELSIQRKQLEAIIETILPACTEPDIKTGAPFRAQAIIANPPAYGTFMMLKWRCFLIYNFTIAIFEPFLKLIINLHC